MATNHSNSSQATISGVVQSGFKRRAVLHAGWTVPAVLAVTAAPALALSGPIDITSFAGSCKLPGNSCSPASFGYRMIVTFTANQAGSVHIDSFDITGAPTTGISPTTFAVGAGNTQVIFEVYSTTSSQRSATITYTFTPTGGSPGTYTASVDLASFKPCKNC
jgi:hypothetical protein